jgi:hypothetical protein
MVVSPFRRILRAIGLFWMLLIGIVAARATPSPEFAVDFRGDATLAN